MRLIRMLVIVCALATPAPVLGSVQPFDMGLAAQGKPFDMGLSAQGQPPQPAQDEFVPADQLPPDAELPAARMVIGAYVFVWVAFIVYMFTLIRRVKKVEADLATLERDRGRP